MEEQGMFEKMMGMIRGKNKKIVFTEGEDLRILTAASKLYEDNLLIPVLVGDTEKIQEVASKNNISLENIEIINPESYEKFDEMAEEMFALRKGKMTKEECCVALKKPNYFGTMLVKMNEANGLLGGATYSTADTVRPALQLVKTKPGQKIVSSCFVLNRKKDGNDERYMMGDCAINLDPSAEELAEIAKETAICGRLFDIEPKVAMLSFSTLGSGKGESVEKVKQATALLKEDNLDFAVDGELQFDAAFAKSVAEIKAPTSNVAGQANTFIFPNIDSGNIGYKIAQRLGGFEAFGPILLGLNAPINDLSRGCTIDEIYNMAIITIAQSM